MVAARDIDELRDRDPILLALDPNQEFHERGFDLTPSSLAEQSQEASTTLITDASALSRIAAPPDRGETPLGPLVRANYMLGGRGLIDTARADLLVSAGGRSDLTGLLDVVRASFRPDAVLRLQRTAELVGMALGVEAVAEDRSEDDSDAQGGRLSASEVAAILPWLLEQDAATSNASFWRHLGGLFDLAILEEVSTALGSQDVSALIRANMDVWVARRAYLGLAVSPEENEEAPSRRGWHFRGGLLAFEAGNHRVTFSTDGRSLPGRDSSRVPRWNGIRSAVEAYRLEAVNLRGITRSVAINAEESDDVLEDADHVAASLNEEFFVPELTLRVHGGPPDRVASDVSIRFARSLAVADQGATIEALTHAVLEVVSFADPVASDEVSRVLAAAESDPRLD